MITAGRQPAMPAAVVGIAALLLVSALAGPNGLLGLTAAGVLLLGCRLLWRPGESPILLAVFGMQWLQASLQILHANWRDVDVAALAPFGGEVHLAIALSLAGLAMLTIGMRVGAGRWSPNDGARAREAAASYRVEDWFRLYLLALAAAMLLQSVAWMVAGLAQPLLALAGAKWAFYWLLAYATFSRPSADRRFLALAFGVELLLGLGGYFAGFRAVLVFTFLALLAAGLRLSARRWLALVALAAFALLLASAWLSIRPEYRDFVSGGVRAQIVTVGYGERLAKLAELAGRLDGAAVADGAGAALSRLAYVNFFALVLDTVPEARPHAAGAIWWDAVTRPFMPRLLFPDKAPVHDSARTAYYTGVGVAGVEQGTSISVGYMAEAYIDFGPVGMMGSIFGFGLLLGLIYRWLIRWDQSGGLVGMALATATLYGAMLLETSITKSFGSLAVSLLVAWLLLRFGMPWIRAALGGGRSRATPVPPAARRRAARPGAARRARP